MSAASGARAAGVATHRHHQPDSRLHAGTRDRRTPGYRLPEHGNRPPSLRRVALTLFLTLSARARALMARPWSARCYGVARQREGSRQNSIGGSGVLSLRHFSSWFSLSLGAWAPKNLARRSMVSAGAMLLGPARAAWAVQRLQAARWRGRRRRRRRFRFIDFGAR
jgi:hypothetical protein